MENQNVKPQALADRMKTSYQNVWRWINLARGPRRKNEAALERALNLPENGLRKHPDDSGEDGFLAGLSEHGRDEVRNYAEYWRQKEKDQEVD